MEGILKPDSYGFYCKIEVVEDEFPGDLSGESVPRGRIPVKRELDPDVPSTSLNQTSSSILTNSSFEFLPSPKVESGTLHIPGDTTKSSFNVDPLSNISSLLTIKNEVDLESVESSFDSLSVIDNVARIIELVSRVPSNESLGSWPYSIRSHSQTSKIPRLKQIKQFKRKKIIPIKSAVPKNAKKGSQYECNECRRSCASKLGLIRHLSVHFRRVKSYPCSTCSQTFPSLVELKTHVRSHNTCRVCGLNFIGIKCLDKHVLREHGTGRSNGEPEKKSFECDSCNLVFKSKSTLIRHIASHWPTVEEKLEDCKRDEPKQVLVSHKRFRCNICKPIKKFHSSFTFHTHLRSHNKCIHCDRSYLDVQSLDKHTFAIHNNGNGFTCERCETNFVDKRKLTFHVKFAHWELPFQCADCERSFSRSKTLDRHRKRHGDGTGCTCLVCGKHFASSGGLEAHTSVHDKELGTNNPVLRAARVSGGAYPCKLCPKRFTSREGYSAHVCSEHVGYERLFQCTDCPKSFRCTSSLRAHSKIHSANGTNNDYKHMCSFCGAFFRRRHTLDRHLQTHQGNKRCSSFKCKLCSKSYSLKGSLQRHVKMTHNPNGAIRYNCQNCDKNFYSPHRLKEHSLKHQTNPEYRFKCQLCEKAYFTKHQLANHLLWHTGEKPFECEFCMKVYRSVGSLNTHQAIHHNECTFGSIPSFSCRVCNKSYLKLFALNHHRKKKGHDLVTTDSEAGAPHKCHECDKLFPSQNILSKHVESVHAKKQKATYVCEICALVVSKSSELRYHKRTKHGERNFRCTECEKAFFSRYHLNEHLKRHGEPGFKCNKCGLTYFTPRHLRQHRIRIHSKIKELFICNECGRSISSKESLVIHLRTHSGIRPFHCRVCYKTFISNGSLKVHMSTHS